MLRLVAEHHSERGLERVFCDLCFPSSPLSLSSIIDQHEKSLSINILSGGFLARRKKNFHRSCKLEIMFRYSRIAIESFFLVTKIFPFAILRSLNASGSHFFYSIALAFHLIKFHFMNQKFLSAPHLSTSSSKFSLRILGCVKCRWIRWNCYISTVNRLSSLIENCGNGIVLMEN